MAPSTSTTNTAPATTAHSKEPSRNLDKKKKQTPAAAAAAVGTEEAKAVASGRDSPNSAIGEAANHGAAAEKENVRKQIRNLQKKLSAMSKVDSILKENPGITLDDLVTSKKINQDQKAQALKKPHYEAQLSSMEERLALYLHIESEHQKQLEQELKRLTLKHEQEMQNALSEQDVLKSKVEAAEQNEKDVQNQFFTFSCFLATASMKRQPENLDETPLGVAFEGALQLVYLGDLAAAKGIDKIVNGSPDIVCDVNGISTGISYSRVKEVALEEAALFHAQPAVEADENEAPPSTYAQVDPTIANAGLTELDDLSTSQPANGSHHFVHDSPIAGTNNGGIDAEAANAAASQGWDPSQSGDFSEFEMVTSRDAQEPVADVKQRWADIPTEVSAPSASSSAAVAPTSGSANHSTKDTSVANDGFHEVRHHHGGRGRGGSSGHHSYPHPNAHNQTHRGGFRGGENNNQRAPGSGFNRGGNRGNGGFRNENSNTNSQRGGGYRGGDNSRGGSGWSRGGGRGGYRGEHRGGEHRGGPPRSGQTTE